MANPTGPGGSWTLVWSDEFPGSSVDTTKWYVDNGVSRNGTPMYSSNVTVSGGYLSIALPSASSGGCLMSADVRGVGVQPSNGYKLPIGGCLEARVNFPGSGTQMYNWPAFWTVGGYSNWPACGEYDIAEVNGWSGGAGGSLGANYHGTTNTNVDNIGGNWDGWHTYTLVRNATTYDVYWDGTLKLHANSGDDGSDQGIIFVNAASSGSGVFSYPTTMQVDYVRAWTPTASAPAFVQGVAQNSFGSAASSLVLTLGVGINTTAGNTLIANSELGAVNGVISSASDSKGNTWTVDASGVYSGGASSVSLASCYLTTPLVAGDTITFNFSGSGSNGRVAVLEFSGIVSSSRVDKSFGTSQASGLSITAATSAPTTQASELAICVSGHGGATAGAYTVTAADPNSGGTWTDPNYAIDAWSKSAYQVLSSTTTVSGTWTTTGTAPMSAVVATYKATAGSISLSPSAVSAAAHTTSPTVTAASITVHPNAVSAAANVGVPTITATSVPAVSNVLATPNLVVEGAFSSTPDGDRIWNNITSYIDLDTQALDCQQRRTNMFDERTPGTLTFLVDNSGDEFTKENNASPFYPGVTQNTPLRMRIQFPITVNLLTGAQSRTDDVNGWSVAAGGLTTSATSPATGVSSSVVWSTGVLAQTGVHVGAGQTEWGKADDRPVYCKQGDKLSARIALKLGASATFSASLRLAWIDVGGNIISEVSSSVTALTTSWQTLTITNATAPANTKSARLAVANETTVGPTVAAIGYDGGDDVSVNNTLSAKIQVPPTAQPGDLAIIWRRSGDPSINFNNITGWTWTGTTYTDARGRTRLDTKILTEQDIGKTLTVSWQSKNRCYVAITTYSGVDQSTPLHQNQGIVDTVSEAGHTTPNVTTTVNGCWIVSAVFDTSTTTSTWSAPGSEYVRQYGFTLKGNAVTGIISDDATAHGTGTYGSKTFTSNVASRYSTMHTLALKSAAGTGPGNVDVYMGAPMLVKATSLPSFVTAGDWTSIITVYADSWTQEWDVDRPKVTVVGTDRTKLLQVLNIKSAIYESIMDSDPMAYYMLNESGDSAVAADSSLVSQPTLGPVQVGAAADQQINWGTGIGPGVDGMASLTLTPTDVSNGIVLVGELDTPTGGTDQMSATFCINSSYAGSTEISLAKFTSPQYGLRMFFEFYGHGGAGAYLGVKIRDWGDATTLDVAASTSTNYFDGNTHQVVGTLQYIGGQAVLKLYVDSVLKATTTQATARTYLPLLHELQVGGVVGYQRCCQGTFSHVAAFPTCLAPEDVTDMYTAAFTAYAGDTKADRVNRILDWVGLGGIDLDDSGVILDRHMPDPATALAALQLVAATDGGTLYIDGDDNVAIRSANFKQLQYAPTITIAGEDLGVSPLSVIDDTILINDITINRVGAGTSQHLTNQASVLAHGTHDKAIDTMLMTDAEAREMAGYYMSFYSEPYTRFDSIAIEGLLFADWPDLLDLDMWQIVRMTDLPASAPATIIDSHVEGRQWTITADSWLVTLDVSYAIPFAVVGDATRGVFGNVVVAN